MKTIQFTGTPPGPAFTVATSRLSEAYDFSVSGICDMADADAYILLSQCGASFKELTAATVSAAATRAVTDATTAPVLASAVVIGKNLVLTYTESTSLKPVCVVGDFDVQVDGAPNVVTKVTHGANTITLALTTLVAAGQVVTIAYDNTTVYDTNDNAALAAVAAAVTNSTVDIQVPVLSTAIVTGNSLVLTYTEIVGLHTTQKPVPADFAVVVGGVANAVTSVTVAAQTVTLALTTAATASQVTTVTYTRSAHATAFLKDTTGNAAANLVAQAVTNATLPVFVSAAVTGNSLVLTYTASALLHTTEKPVVGDFVVLVAGAPDVVTSVTVLNNTVTLALTTAVTASEVTTVSYTKSGSATAFLKTTLSNAAAANLVTAAVTNNTVPVLVTAEVNGANLVLTYTASALLHTTEKPVVGDYAVVVAGAPDEVVSVTVLANVVTLVLTAAAVNGNVVTIGYTKSASATAFLKTTLSNTPAANLVAQAVTNVTA